MADTTTVIDVIINAVDQTQAGSQSAILNISRLEQNIRRAEDSMNRMKKKSKLEIAITAIDKASKIINGIMSTGRKLIGKAWNVTISVIDRVTAPIRGMISRIGDLIGITGIASAVLGGLTIKNALDTNATQARYETQLRTVLNNQGVGAAGNAAVLRHAANMQAQTMYSGTAMTAAAAEFATYISDVDAIKQMMGVMADYAAGMTGGLEVTESQMTDLATQLGKALNAEDAAFDGLKKKGFGFTDEQEKILKSIKTTDLQKVAVLQEVIGQSWEGLAKAMTETPLGKIAQLKNDWVDILAIIGNRLEPATLNFFKMLHEKIPSVGRLLESGASSLNRLFENAIPGISRMIDAAFENIDRLSAKLSEITGRTDFRDASLFGKIGILWDEIIAQPFDKWWQGTGKAWLAEKAQSIGKGIGTGLKSGIMGLLGIETNEAANEAVGIGKSFAEGFVEGFDAEKVMKAIWDAMVGFAKAHPIITALFLGSKALPAISGGLQTAASMKQLFGAGGAMAGAGSALLPLARVAIPAAGAVMGASTIYKGINELIESNKTNDEEYQRALRKAAAWRAGGTIAGGVIGGIAGAGVGAGLGLGLGAAFGNFMAERTMKKFEEQRAKFLEEQKAVEAAMLIAQQQAKYSSHELKAAIADVNVSAEQFGRMFQRVVMDNLNARFGDIAFSLDEISAMARELTFSDSAESLKAFATATNDVRRSLSDMESAAYSLEKLNWKLTRGFTWSDDEMENYKDTMSKLFEDTRQMLENKHFEADFAFRLLLGDELGGQLGQWTDNAFWNIANKLGPIEKQMQDVFKNMKLTPEEKQTQISDLYREYQDQLAIFKQAEDVGTEFITAKFGGGEMDTASFVALMKELPRSMEDARAAADEQLKSGLQYAKLMSLQFGEGFDYEGAVAKMTQAYQDKVQKIDMQPAEFVTSQIAERFPDVADLILPEGTGDLQSRIQQFLATVFAGGIDISVWGPEDWATALGLGNETELAGQLGTLLTPAAEAMSKNFVDSLQFDKNVAITKLRTLMGEIQKEATANPVKIPVEFERPVGMPSTGIPIIGGQAPQPPGFATGGIFTRPQIGLFAEDGAEAVIPLTDRSRGLSLWQKAGEMLGVGSKPYSPVSTEMAAAPSPSVPVTIESVSFEIKVDGGSPDSVINNIKSGIKELTDQIAYDLSMSIQQSFANTPKTVGEVF